MVEGLKINDRKSFSGSAFNCPRKTKLHSLQFKLCNAPLTQLTSDNESNNSTEVQRQSNLKTEQKGEILIK